MSPSLVLDSSVALTWCFSDEITPATKSILTRLRTGSAIVPSLWFLEIANVLTLAERKGRILPHNVGDFISTLRKLVLKVDTDSTDRAFEQVLVLCRQHGLTSYDAVYLDLAIRTGLPLATLDRSLKTAAVAAGVSLQGI